MQLAALAVAAAKSSSAGSDTKDDMAHSDEHAGTDLSYVFDRSVKRFLRGNWRRSRNNLTNK